MTAQMVRGGVSLARRISRMSRVQVQVAQGQHTGSDECRSSWLSSSRSRSRAAVAAVDSASAFSTTTTTTADVVSKKSTPEEERLAVIMNPRRPNFTIKQKIALLKELEKQQRENNVSMAQVAKEMNVCPTQLCRWRQQLPKFEKKLSTTNLYRSVNLEAKSTHPGKVAFLHNIREELLLFVSQQREQGVPVTFEMIIAHAMKLDVPFSDKTVREKYHAVRLFCSTHGIDIIATASVGVDARSGDITVADARSGDGKS